MGLFVAKPKKHELSKVLGDESKFDSDGMWCPTVSIIYCAFELGWCREKYIWNLSNKIVRAASSWISQVQSVRYTGFFSFYLFVLLALLF